MRVPGSSMAGVGRGGGAGASLLVCARPAPWRGGGLFNENWKEEGIIDSCDRWRKLDPNGPKELDPIRKLMIAPPFDLCSLPPSPRPPPRPPPPRAVAVAAENKRLLPFTALLGCVKASPAE
jgi:hypothetical protein